MSEVGHRRRSRTVRDKSGPLLTLDFGSFSSFFGSGPIAFPPPQARQAYLELAELADFAVDGDGAGLLLRYDLTRHAARTNRDIAAFLFKLDGPSWGSRLHQALI
jgi:hypothetical protein